MVTTVSTAFKEFYGRIIPTPAQSAQVRDRAQRAEAYLRRFFGPDHDMPVTRVTLVGSAARLTDIRPVHDIDVLAEFSNKDNIFATYRGNSHAFINRIRNTLDANTQLAQIGTRGQAVRLFYQDGLHVDIAPVFRWSTGGFALPNGAGGWQTTDPLAQAAWGHERERALGGFYKRRVRMLKRWNDVHSNRLTSYHLEVMVGVTFASMTSNSRECLWRFFEWAPNHLSAQDPAGHFGNLSEGLTGNQRQDILDSFATNQERARRANLAEGDGNQTEAIRLWRVVLGDEFPAYG